MTAYLTFMFVLHALGVLAVLNTTPRAPRGPEPSARALMVLLLIHCAILAWTMGLMFGGAS